MFCVHLQRNTRTAAQHQSDATDSALRDKEIMPPNIAQCTVYTESICLIRNTSDHSTLLDPDSVHICWHRRSKHDACSVTNGRQLSHIEVLSEGTAFRHHQRFCEYVSNQWPRYERLEDREIRCERCEIRKIR